VKGFLNFKNFHLADAWKQVVEIYGEDVNNDGNVWEWCRLFK
jgi:hypothetical protein